MSKLPEWAARWDLTLVDTQADVEAFLAWADGVEALAIDTETVGLDWTERDFTRLVQFADGERSFAVPVRWWGRPLQQALESIRRRGAKVYMHNAQFDQHALADDGLPHPEWQHVIDTRFLHHLLVPHRPHGLKPVSAERFGGWARAGESTLKREMAEHRWDWATVPVDLPSYWMYGCLDTLLTFRLGEELVREVEEGGMWQAFEREMQVAEVMWGAERRGIRIDHKYAERTRTEWLSRAVDLKAQLSAAGLTNPNSNQQIAALFREMGWEPEDFTDTGQAVVDKMILKALADEWPDLVHEITEYKQITKWIGAYLDPFADSKGRVHPSINTLRAKTGRMSITNPALQTLPSRGSSGAIRRCVLPETGHVIYAIDYDGQEARLFANYSGDPGMAAAYGAGDDLYTHVARIVWDDQSIDKSDRRRSTAKVILLAFTYGAGVPRLAEASGLSVDETERFLAKLFVEFPTIREMTGDHAIGGHYPGAPALAARERAEAEGVAYVTTGGGRRFSMPTDETYKAVNGIMQGTGADVLKGAIVRLAREGLADYIIAPVHDEVVFSFPKDEHEQMAKVAALAMEDREWEIPLTVEASGPFPHWGAAYGFSDE